MPQRDDSRNASLSARLRHGAAHAARVAAVLAALAAMVAAPPALADEALRELESPLAVRVRLADGVAITGVISAWSEEGVLGSFGYRRWIDLRPTDTQRLFGRLMDRGDAADWVALGRVLLLSPGGAGMAESAFRRALGLDRDSAAAIEAVRDEVRRLQQRNDDGPDRLRLDEPEGRDWPATPWRPLSPIEQAAATDILREDLETILAIAGIDAAILETDQLLLCSDGSNAEIARLAIRLERVLATVSTLLGLPEGQPEPWGRYAVIVTADRSAFRRLQQRVFLQLDRPDITAMCHCVGGKVFVVAFVGSGGDDLAIRLARGLTHGALHRHISPLRLPAWANEGLAESVAARIAPESFVPRAARREALQFIRGGGDVARILESDYGDPAWPGPDGIGPALGRLVVDLMLRERPGGFAEWVVAVKRGQPWQEAMAEHFRTPWSRVGAAVVAFHRTND